MADVNKIERLLADFYNGDTTPEEENFLAQFFNNHEISEKWYMDRDLFAALYHPSRIQLPEGVSERLASVIDKYVAETTRKTQTRKLYVRILSAAAVALLCIGLFFTQQRTSKQDFIADTYTNPEEAAIAAEQALLFVSAKLNQGLSPLKTVKESVNKTNEILTGI